MVDVKKEYRVVAVEAAPNGVMLGIAPIFSCSKEESEHVPSPTRVLAGPAGQSEEAKMMQEMMRGVFDEIDRRFKEEAARRPPSEVSSRELVVVALTVEEYMRLGKPTPNDVVVLALNLQPAVEGEEAEQARGHLET